MTTIDLIKTRRTIKMFRPDPISDKELISWLEAASYAPNHRLNEPWEILFIGPETRSKLNHKTDFGHAPVVLAVLSKLAPTPFERDENVIAASCFVQNFLLAAHEEGAGAYWSSLGALPTIVKFSVYRSITMLLGYSGLVTRWKFRMPSQERRLLPKSRICPSTVVDAD